jgi:transaldolase
MEARMSKTVIEELALFGQSIWLDNISRSMIKEGKIEEMISLGLKGITSNPTIFDKAISNSSVYDGQIRELAKSGKSTFEIYDEVTIKDIQDTADIFKSVYEKTEGLDGYVSLEINPKLAYKTQETIEEGERLFRKVNRPNVMFKVPSTFEGFEAIEELLARGININITLIFSVAQYVDTAYAYLRGIKRFLENGGDISKVRSVASVFVSRIDTLVDNLLDKLIEKETNEQKKVKLTSLKGKAAVANSKLIYKKFLDIFSSEEFKKLQAQGANMQRVLWGSTSTKNPAYSDIKYVEELIAKHTVNTVPHNTFEAFLDHGAVRAGLTSDVSGAQNVIESLKEIGIDINEVCSKLLRDGVMRFEESFESLLNSMEEKSKCVCKK